MKSSEEWKLIDDPQAHLSDSKGKEKRLDCEEESGWSSGTKLEFYPSNPGLTPAWV